MAWEIVHHFLFQPFNIFWSSDLLVKYTSYTKNRFPSFNLLRSFAVWALSLSLYYTESVIDFLHALLRFLLIPLFIVNGCATFFARMCQPQSKNDCKRFYNWINWIRNVCVCVLFSSVVFKINFLLLLLWHTRSLR